MGRAEDAAGEAQTLVPFAVLGLLIEETATANRIGVLLRRRFDGAIGSDSRHARGVLRKLAEDRLVEEIPVVRLPAKERRRAEASGATALYRVTAAGVGAWRAGLVAAMHPRRAQTELTVRLGLVREDDYAAMLAILDQFERARLSAGSSVSLIGHSKEKLPEGLARDHVRAQHGADLQWVMRARERVEDAIARAAKERR